MFVMLCAIYGASADCVATVKEGAEALSGASAACAFPLPSPRPLAARPLPCPRPLPRPRPLPDFLMYFAFGSGAGGKGRGFKATSLFALDMLATLSPVFPWSFNLTFAQARLKIAKLPRVLKSLCDFVHSLKL